MMILTSISRYASRLVRNLKKQKIYSAVNIVGLAVGLACTLLILLWVQYERSYDGFHSRGGEIYRIINHQSRNGIERDMSGAPPLLGPAIKAQYPEIADYTRLFGYQPVCRAEGDNAPELKTRLIQVDPQFFRLFDFPFLQGHSQTALTDPYSIVINEKTARALFGASNPMGRTILVQGEDALALKVTGLIKNVPANSHLQFDVAMPLDLYRGLKNAAFYEDWKIFWMATYVRLDKKASVPALNEKITALVATRDPANRERRIWLQPLRKIHLDSRIFSDDQNAGAGDSRSILLFTLIAFVVLIIACINFMNLTAARAFARAKEVGIRKVNGAGRRDLVKLFLTETLGLFGLAMVLGALLVQACLPLAGRLVGRAVDWSLLGGSRFLLTAIGITVLSGLAAGFFPALFLSSLRPADALQARWPTGRRSLPGLRRVLLSAQFIAASVLIGITGIVFFQLHFLKTKSLGYDHANMIEIEPSHQLEGRSEAWKGDLVRSPGVLSATASVSLYQSGAAYKKYVGTWEGKADAEPVRFYVHNVDPDFPAAFGVPLKAGRFFAPDSAGEPGNAVINETAARTMGLADPLGKRIVLFQRSLTIIGVLGDFNATSLRTAIDPTVMLFRGGASTEAQPALTVRIRPQNVAETLRDIQSVWRKYCPGTPFRYRFLDDILWTEFYAGDEVFGRMMSGFAAMALFVAGLGLFGLVAYEAERRTREIGIRKVVGATRPQILALMSKDVIPVLVVSNLVAWPLILAVMGRWLGGFAYRVGTTWWLVGLTVLATAAVALATTGYHALHAAGKNPAACLRTE
jgi:putative ABC transport system permease protein